MLDLDLLGDVGRQTQPVRDIGGQVRTADGEHGRMPDIPVDVDRHVGRAAADVDDHHAHLFFGIGQHDFGRRERVEHVGLDLHPGGLNALRQVLHRRGCSRDDVRLDLEPEAVHTERLADALLPVDDEPARDDV